MESKEFLCHLKHGIPTYILSKKFIALRSYVDYEELFEELFNSRETVSNDFNLTKENVVQYQNSIDSAWTKKVVKNVLASTRSRTELISGTVEISRTAEEVSKGMSEREKYFSIAPDELNATLQNKKENIKKKADKMTFKLNQVSHKWSKHRKIIFWKILIHAVNSYKI